MTRTAEIVTDSDSAYTSGMNAAVVSTRATLSGKKRLVGTSISVATVASYFLHGLDVEDIQLDYPFLTREQIEVARQYVARHPEEFGLGLRQAAR